MNEVADLAAAWRGEIAAELTKHEVALSATHAELAKVQEEMGRAMQNLAKARSILGASTGRAVPAAIAGRVEETEAALARARSNFARLHEAVRQGERVIDDRRNALYHLDQVALEPETSGAVVGPPRAAA